MPSTTRAAAPRPLSALPSVASPEETEVLRAAARRAEDAGDFAGASRLIAKLPDDRSSRRWQCELDAARRIDPENRAALACWLVNPALRWARTRPAGALLERHALLMKRTQRAPAGDRSDGVAAACYDPVVIDAALFDGGLFDGYLANLSGSPLLARLPGLKRWSSRPALVWKVLRIIDGGVELRDLYAGALRHARYWPGAAVDALVYGRLVPVAGDVELSFPVAPEEVDQRCAARLVRARRRGSGPEERLRAVAHSRKRAQVAQPAFGA